MVLPQVPKRQSIGQSWYCLSKLRGTRRKATYRTNAGQQHSDPTQSVSQSVTHKHADSSPPRELLFHQNRRQRSPHLGLEWIALEKYIHGRLWRLCWNFLAAISDGFFGFFWGLVLVTNCSVVVARCSSTFWGSVSHAPCAKPPFLFLALSKS